MTAHGCRHWGGEGDSLWLQALGEKNDDTRLQTLWGERCNCTTDWVKQVFGQMGKDEGPGVENQGPIGHGE